MKYLFLTTFAFVEIATSQTFIRINQLGYLPHSVKVAVLVSKEEKLSLQTFTMYDALTDSVVMNSSAVTPYGSYGAFTHTYRLDFSRLTKPGGYYIKASTACSPSFRIADDVYAGTADFLLNYMRQQRCGFNPFLKDSCHTHDGYIIYHRALDSTLIDVVGGWHDASDYLQYVTTSANAIVQMLFAYREHPNAFRDQRNATGLPGANGIPDILDEAKWGLDWLVKMNPSKDLMFNQIADDRDHLGFRLPTEDTVSYGKGKARPVYAVTGQPQGIMKYKNRSTGKASTAGKFASAFALGAQVLQPFYPEFAELIRQKSREAYEIGVASPGVSQTAPCRAPYFYEEDNWLDDMQLAAVQVARALDDTGYYAQAASFADGEGASPWMGADTAHHYQWYPFVNLGHYELAQEGRHAKSVDYLREGLERLAERGKSNPFLFGVPFIWCSNNYVAAALTQVRLHEQLTGDSRYNAMEASLRDWLFGCNPWGTSMIVGLPKSGISPKDPHSAFTHLHGYAIDGGLADGPVRGSIYGSLKGIHLSKADPFAECQSDVAVYHDDWGDYSTNEPTMDGTASLTYYLSSLETEHTVRDFNREIVHGAVTRMNSAKKEIYLVFTGHEFADGGTIIRRTLKKLNVKGSFFFTGDFYRKQEFKKLIAQLKKDGHYLGAHSDKHLLYASWENRDSLLVTREQFLSDIKANFAAMKAFGVEHSSARWFLPPFEWYNQSISEWCRQVGLTPVSFTPGTSSNADYTTPGMKNYLTSDSIYQRILRHESKEKNRLNGFLLLLHIGTTPQRTDKFYTKLDMVIRELKRRGYDFRSLRDVPL